MYIDSWEGYMNKVHKGYIELVRRQERMVTIVKVLRIVTRHCRLDDRDPENRRLFAEIWNLLT